MSVGESSYVLSLALVEIMTSKTQKEFVESYTYLDRINGWDLDKTERN